MKKNSIDLLHNKLIIKFPEYEKFYKLLIYNNAKDILIIDKYGICKTATSNLLIGRTPTIESSLNKNEYFINMFNNKFKNNNYIFDKFIYKRTHEKATVICKLHGDFLMTPANLLFGQNCNKCSRESTTNFNKKNPNGWNKTNWYNKALTSKNFDSFKVYILEFYDEHEKFYKIGRTFTKIKRRFEDKRNVHYNYNIIDIYNFKELTQENAIKCFDLENNLKLKNKQYKYIPKYSFDGMQECFKKLDEVDYINNHRSDLVAKILEYEYKNI